jgi:virginiamycin B lyase
MSRACPPAGATPPSIPTPPSTGATPQSAVAILLSAVVSLLSACATSRAEPSLLPSVVAVRDYAIPWEPTFPGDVAVGADGRVWFTDRMAHVIGVFDPVRESFTAYATPTARSAPYGIVAGPDGALWFAESRAGRLGRLDPSDGSIVEFELPGATGGPHLLAWHDGRLWFTLRESSGYGWFEPQTGASRVHASADAVPYAIVSAGGRIWMTSFASYRLLEVRDPDAGVLTVHDLSAVPDSSASAAGPGLDRRRARAPGEVRRAAAGPAGEVWFTTLSLGGVRRYEPGRGRITRFESVDQDSRPYGIAATSTGLVWYGERGSNVVIALDPYANRRLRVEAPRLDRLPLVHRPQDEQQRRAEQR